MLLHHMTADYALAHIGILAFRQLPLAQMGIAAAFSHGVLLHHMVADQALTDVFLLAFRQLPLAVMLLSTAFAGGMLLFVAADDAGANIAGLILGLLLSVICTVIRKKKTKTKDNSLPMIPYLSVGFLTAYMIGGIIL